MIERERLTPVLAAKKLISSNFPHCQGALLAGSVVRGEATQTSDLDIVIFEKDRKASYRESLFAYDWPMEIFVHGFSSYKYFFMEDCRRGRPSMPQMVAEGVVLKDEGMMGALREEASECLNRGPEPWSKLMIDTKRYFITDALDDLIGCQKREEALFIANTLAELVSEFYLRTNRQWTGASKWLVRALKQFDPNFTLDFVSAFDLFYRTNQIEGVAKLVDKVLEPYGGRFFHGFISGEKKA
ncbi:nucleotidyltransferase domain-containing protein [Sutcliffiella halmapala]|uniref:nucleotidyltransferase domain-containing protein n=1 Tax=Sutcliffiella halmapala TaxID=79882 RepID=UPI000994F4C9|nr:nucleotidyltransferase domain-containing protein [Sutcliffiella halmapala]